MKDTNNIKDSIQSLGRQLEAVGYMCIRGSHPFVLFGPDAQLKLIVRWQVTLAEDLALSLVLFHIFPLCLVARSYFVCGVFLWGFCALICLYLGNFVQGWGGAWQNFIENLGWE